MIKNQFPVHIFHSYGYGFGAQIREPFCETLDTQAATSISSTGGHSLAIANKVNLREIIRIEQAITQIAAVEEEDSYDTVVTASVEKINIFNQVTADRIVAHLATKYYKKKKPMSFRTIGSRYENLRIAGIPIHVELEDEDGENYGGKAPTTDHPVIDANRPDEGRINAKYNAEGHLTTLCKKISGGHDRLKIHGNSIIVPDFGVVHLAECLVAHNSRHINMLRVELGCGIGGRGSGPGIGSNGQSVPPPT